MSKQHHIKFVITIKTSILNIKLVLFHIIFKNDVVNKKRFNFIDESIFKLQYFDTFFNSVFNFNFNFNAPRKINIDILNL